MDLDPPGLYDAAKYSEFHLILYQLMCYAQPGEMINR